MPAAIQAKRATLSDLFVLIFGVALALSLQWHASWRTIPHPSLPNMPIWKWDGEFVEEAIEKTCLALIPLMLWRRLRLGGVCRPAELLLVICGTVPMVYDFDWALWRWDSRFELDTSGYLGALFWQCRAAAWMVSITAIMALIFRNGLSNRARSALLTLAVATSFAWLLIPMENLHVGLTERYELQPTAETALTVAVRTVAFLVPGILFGAAIRDAYRRPRDLPVLGWIGLALVACDLVVAAPVNLWGRHMPWIPPLRDYQLHVMYFGGPLVAGIIGWLLAPLTLTYWDGWSDQENPDRANTVLAD